MRECLRVMHLHSQDASVQAQTVAVRVGAGENVPALLVHVQLRHPDSVLAKVVSGVQEMMQLDNLQRAQVRSRKRSLRQAVEPRRQAVCARRVHSVRTARRRAGARARVRTRSNCRKADERTNVSCDEAARRV